MHVVHNTCSQCSNAPYLTLSGMGVVRKETDLNNDEKHFLLAVERGDIPTARHFLEESQIYFNININCVDPLGRTALLIAIENENIEMIGKYWFMVAHLKF